MKTFTLQVKEINRDGDEETKEVELRLKSSDAIKIEEMYKVKLLDFIQDYSIKAIVTLLRYMLKGGKNAPVTQDEAQDFFDKIVDQGWAVETIVTDIIMPACEASGLLTKSDLDLIRDKKEEAKEQATQA